MRAAGINAEIYPEPVKIGKQLKYVNERQAPYAIIVGSEEMKTRQLTLKDMKSGQQEMRDFGVLLERMRNNRS